MGFSLDQALEIILREMPELGPALEPRRDKIQETLDALSLQEGESYLSMGLAKNILPLIVAMQGLYVVGLDISPNNLKYQSDLAKRFTIPLHNANGKFEVYNFNFDITLQTKPLDDFQTSDKSSFQGQFDVVEFANITSLIGEDDDYLEVADILLSFGKPESRYLILTWGPAGYMDLTANALLKEAKRQGRHAEIPKGSIELLVTTSDYGAHVGVMVKAYRAAE